MVQIKKAVSPLIATIVLISFTIAIGSLIINWGKQFITAQTQSLQQTGVECQKESLDVANAVYNKTSGKLTLAVRNSGSVGVILFSANLYTSDGSVYSSTINDTLIKVGEAKTVVFTFNRTAIGNKSINYVELPSKHCPQNLYYSYNVNLVS